MAVLKNICSAAFALVVGSVGITAVTSPSERQAFTSIFTGGNDNAGAPYYREPEERPGYLQASGGARRAYDLVKGDLSKLPADKVSPEEIAIVGKCVEDDSKRDYKAYSDDIKTQARKENVYVCVLRSI